MRFIRLLHNLGEWWTSISKTISSFCSNPQFLQGELVESYFLFLFFFLGFSALGALSIHVQSFLVQWGPYHSSFQLSVCSGHIHSFFQILACSGSIHFTFQLLVHPGPIHWSFQLFACTWVPLIHIFSFGMLGVRTFPCHHLTNGPRLCWSSN